MAPVPFLSVKFDGQALDPLVRAVTVEDNDRLVDEATLTFEDPDGKGADLFAADKTLKVIAESSMGSSVYSTPVPAHGTLFVVNRNQLYALAEGATH